MSMTIKIYNTLTRDKEVFKPLEKGKVGIYVCGPTVYNYIHIGNARPAIVFDTVRRYFKYKGYDVNYVLNFTDRSEEHTSELQSRGHLVCRLLLEKKKPARQGRNSRLNYIYCLA